MHANSEVAAIIIVPGLTIVFHAQKSRWVCIQTHTSQKMRIDEIIKE